MIALKYKSIDPDNCRTYYSSDNGVIYCTVDNILHTCTDEWEPMYPVDNSKFIIKE